MIKIERIKDQREADRYKEQREKERKAGNLITKKQLLRKSNQSEL